MFKKILVFTVLFCLIAQGALASSGQALTEEGLATLKAKLLERHEALVAKAEEVLANKDNLLEYIKTKADESQAKALELAQQRAAEATDQELAAKWLNKAKAKQEYRTAHIEKNADKMAENMLKRAEAVLENAAEIRTKIEAAENLEELRELRPDRGIKRPMMRLKGILKRFGR
ncbi:MAG: hypothetical protein KGZ53_00385 [Peptococcaceae bacterium]|nr:hypothetical protein [Peptococcaceae bacterium]